MPSSNPIRCRFGSWGNGLRAAGLEVKKPTISEKCRENMIAAHQGKRSFAWKGGRHKDNNGYIQVWMPEHPNAKGGRDKSYIAEHRLIMSNHLGRPLKPNENVHHINGKRDDNRIENLELWVTMQPSGQRPEDLVKFAKEILDAYPEI
jgi:hypothetical protein